jgi:hypothetical protein
VRLGKLGVGKSVMEEGELWGELLAVFSVVLAVVGQSDVGGMLAIFKHLLEIWDLLRRFEWICKEKN